MASDAQKQIRENTLELQEFLNDLKQWEHRVKEKDKKLKSQSQHEKSLETPPIRGHADRLSSEPTDKVSHTQQNKGEISTTHRVQTAASREQNKAQSTSASHTYDHFHEKWDKFDVEAALSEVDGKDVSKTSYERPTQKELQLRPNVINQTGSASQSTRVRSFSQIDQRLENLGTIDNLSRAVEFSEPFPDAVSEKELGNKYFKEKKFVQAIECYCRSIALQPSAVAYGNRAMAYIKIRRFKEAEADCTEAIALDDRYVKAYSRRGTVRKELGNFLGAVEDTEFALRLEPENKELQKQYLEAKALCEKNAGVNLVEKKVSLPIEEIRTPPSNKTDSKSDKNLMDFHSSGQKLVSSTGDVSTKSSMPLVQETAISETKSRKQSEQSLGSTQKARSSIQDVAAQVAAARVAARSVTTAPKTFYEFESMWKNFAGNLASQAELVKVLKPSSLPSLFKDNLSPKLLSEIIRTLEYFFPDSASFAVEVLENLTKIRRFDMTIMCLTSKEKAELRELWERAFLGGEQASEICDVLSGLRVKYRL